MTKSAQGNDEKALRLERETMLRVIECMRDGVYVVSQDYDIEYVSPILEREYGEWRGLKCYQYFETRDGVCSDCRNSEVFAGNTVRYEWYSVKNGKTFEVIDTPLANPDGSQSKLEIFRDITDRKRAEKELKQYRDRLERLVEERTADLQKTNEELRTRERFLTCLSEISHRLLRSNDLRTTLPEIVQLLGEVTGVNRCYLIENDRSAEGGPRCKRRYEWTPDAGASKVPAQEAECASYADMGLGSWARLFSRGETVAGVLGDFRPSVRSWLEARGADSVLAVPLIVAGEWSGFVAVDACDGAREWKQEENLLRVAAGEIAVALKNVELARSIRSYATTLEDRVAERTAELVAVNRELESFAYSVSHDLRAPLRSITGFTGAVFEDCGGSLDRDAKDHLQRVLSASRRMGEMIDTLLDLSRVSRREMHQGTVDLSALARLVIEDLRQRDPGREVEVAITPGLATRGDAHLLQLVLENLLGNAWKFTSKKQQAKIEFGVQDLEAGSAFFVRDDGSGFDMEYAAKLFDPFQRLHTDADFEGSGIGLATVFRIVHRHGGHVWAEAEINRGARFFFTVGRACPDDSPVIWVKS